MNTAMTKKANATKVAKVESANVANAIDNNAVQQVINAINNEAKTFGAIIRDFVAVAKENAIAEYMLRVICNDFKLDNGDEPAPIWIRFTVNDIRQAVVAAFPYVHNGVMLHKVNGLYIPYEQYSADIIKKAFYNAVGATKVQKDFAPATEEQIAEAEEQAAKKKEERAEKKAAKKANEEMLARFFEEMMQATEDNCWDIVCKYKAATTTTEMTEEKAA